MPEVRQTQQFRTWLRRLKDSNTVARIVARIRRTEQGNFGDTRSVGAGVMELRVDLAIASTTSIVEPNRDPAMRWRQPYAATGHQALAGDLVRDLEEGE